MKTFRKRTGKKKGQFTQPDEFQTLTRKAMDYIQMNTKTVYIALGALAVALVVVVAVSMVMASSRTKLAAKQAEALRYYDLNSPVPGNKPMAPTERMQKAAQLFAELAKNGGPIGSSSLYYKANAEMELGDLDSAIRDFKETIAKAGDDRLLTSLADMRMAAGYNAKGQVQQAMETYMSVIKAGGGYLKDEAHYRLGGIYEKAGQKDRAAKEYRAIEKDFPRSPWAAESRLRADALEGKPQAVAAEAMPGAVQMVPAQAPPAQTGTAKGK